MEEESSPASTAHVGVISSHPATVTADGVAPDDWSIVDAGEAMDEDQPAGMAAVDAEMVPEHEAPASAKLVMILDTAKWISNREFNPCSWILRGHKSYVPNMISGASQADIGVPVISARKGEFETGYEKGGQTREHVLVAKTLGVSKLVVVVNKMDNPTVKWTKERMPIIDKYKDMGTVVMGKIESGTIREGDSIVIMPNKVNVKVLYIHCDEDRVSKAGPGENVRVKLSGIEEEDILSGFVLCSAAKPISAVEEFKAQLHILVLVDNAIFTAGYKAVLHIHSVVEECEIVELIEEIDLKKKKDADPKKAKPKRRPLFVKAGAVVVCRVQVSNTICIENFSDFPQLGRFTLRTEGKTVAVGKVVGLPPPGNTTF